MVRNSKDKKRPFKEGDWKGFVRCEFTDKLREVFAVWCEENPFDGCMERVLGLVDEGFKFSVSTDENNATYIASLTGTGGAAAACAGWTLTARGRDIGRAIQALAFKHFHVMGEDWSDHMAAKDDDRDNAWVG